MFYGVVRKRWQLQTFPRRWQTDRAGAVKCLDGNMRLRHWQLSVTIRYSAETSRKFVLSVTTSPYELEKPTLILLRRSQDTVDKVGAWYLEFNPGYVQYKHRAPDVSKYPRWRRVIGLYESYAPEKNINRWGNCKSYIGKEKTNLNNLFYSFTAFVNSKCNRKFNLDQLIPQRPLPRKSISSL